MAVSNGPEAVGVQFVSRVLMPEGPLGSLVYPSVRFSSGEELRISVELDFQTSPTTFTFAQPWPQAPSIGAFEFVDPYADMRWPARVLLRARIELAEPNKKPVAFARELLGGLRNILVDSFRNIELLQGCPDQLLQTAGYRRIYYTVGLDVSRNPVPSSEWHLFPARPLEPVGPGFIRVDRSVEDRNCHAVVWSQGISYPQPASLPADEPEVRKRVQEIKRHWNSHEELHDAERHAERGDAKASVRSGAAAVEAAVKFYCTLWGVEFPKGSSTFIDKIEEVLRMAGRPSYRAVNSDAAKSLLKLYRARSSMHEGDCFYNDPDSGDRVDVKHPEARRMVEEAKRFVFWLDSIA